jgi:putative DNA primase/helicase
MLAIAPTVFDADKWLLGVDNGVIDLRTGALLAHDRDRYITQLCPAPYIPDAPCPRWEKFLDEIMGGDKEMIAFLQRLMGCCLTGDIAAQVFPIFHGKGANGKSVFIDTYLSLLGGYAFKAAQDFVVLSKGGGKEHPTEIAALQGKRLVVASETEEGQKLRVQLVKAITGDKDLTGRFMRCDFFTFERTHKTILITNNRPVITEPTNAIWRRVKLVPFAVIFLPEQQDENLLDKLRAEWPGILAWTVRGCLEWQRIRLAPPAKVEAASREYRAEEDRIGDFLGERCILGPGWVTPKARMWSAYCAWCKETGEEQLTNRAFGERLRQHGLDDNDNKPVRDGKTTVKIWRGVLVPADQRQNEPDYEHGEPDGSPVTGVTDVTGL